MKDGNADELWQQAEAGINRALTPEAKLHILSDMVRARVFEQQAITEYLNGKMGGFLNLMIGQEGGAAAVQSMLTPLDHTISGIRGLGFAIMRGLPMRECYAELMGRSGGSSKGKGGMYSFFSPERHHWGIHGLAAAHTPLAAGLAFALKYQGIPGAVVCIMGESAMNQGVYHETMNLAALFSLPVVFVVENNGFGMFTSVGRSSAFRDCLARRAEMYDMEWDRCAGHDIYAVRACLAPALGRARENHRPSLVEISTYRYYGWSVADANHQKYRTREEIEWHKENRDPVTLWNRRLMEEGIASESTMAGIRKEAKEEAREAVAWALESPIPAIDEITDDVYWETDHRTAASGIGRHFFND